MDLSSLGEGTMVIVRLLGLLPKLILYVAKICKSLRYVLPIESHQDQQFCEDRTILAKLFFHLFW